MSLRAWSPWRITLVWLAWPITLALGRVATGSILVWRAEARAVQARAVLAPQYSDFTLQIGSVPAALLVWVGPPLLLTLLWLWRRRAATYRSLKLTTRPFGPLATLALLCVRCSLALGVRWPRRSTGV